MLKRLALALLTATVVFAQTPAPLVDSIAIVSQGNAPMSEEALRSHLSLKAGQPFSQVELDKSIRTLFESGSYDDVRATPETTADNNVKITFTLVGKARIRTIGFEGNVSVKAKKLLRQISLKSADLLDRSKLHDAAGKIQSYYQSKDFPDASVVTRVTSLDEGKLADVTFVVDEGDKGKIQKITFSGNTHVSAKILRDAIPTKPGSIFSFLTGSGKLDENALDEDINQITAIYRNQGYLEVEVASKLVASKAKKATLQFTITEGDLYRVGTVAFEGNQTYPTSELSSLVGFRSGDPVSPAAIEATVGAIRAKYGKLGRIETSVMGNLLPATGKSMDVSFAIKEGPVLKVGAINVAGNTVTKNIVVAREITLAPGDVFNSQKMVTSEARLKNTGYFDSVKVTPQPSADATSDQRDLNVAVTEGKTGKVVFGAGVSSLDKANIFGEFTQGNFDLFNRSNFFRGDGQKFRLYASVGSKSNQAIMSFEEPWFLDRQLAAGFSLYRTQNEYESDNYDERRAGFEIYARKRLFELVDARLGLRREQVELYDFSDDVSSVIRAEEGSRTVSKVTLTLTRDRRDNVVTPTKGSRYELTTALAGNVLGGNTEYWSVEARGANYFPTFNWWVPQTLAILTRAGTMDNYGDSDSIPLFDRFFLGGPDSVRGFDYRDVGPKASDDEPMGGKSYLFASAEYTFQIHPIFQMAAFYDAGVVNSDAWDFSCGDYNDSWGIGARILIMGAPMRLDYAMPISTDTQNDSGGHFWFSFGTRF